MLKEFLPRAGLFKPAFKAGQLVRPLLPHSLRDKLQPARLAGTWPRREHARKMLALDGCVQPAMAPDINAATARVLDALGVQLLEAPKAGCCGAVRFHMNDQAGG
jgi:glycolate oxidase iron-sulfur subunit